MAGNSDKYIPMFAGLGRQTKLDMAGALYISLYEDTDEGIIAACYTDLRERFRRRFSAFQVDALRPWMALSKEKKKQFTKSWNVATAILVSKGFSDGPNLCELILKLVSLSRYFADKLTFDLILKSLEGVWDHYQDSFPNSSPEALMFVADHLRSTKI